MLEQFNRVSLTSNSYFQELNYASALYAEDYQSSQNQETLGGKFLCEEYTALQSANDLTHTQKSPRNRITKMEKAILEKREDDWTLSNEERHEEPPTKFYSLCQTMLDVATAAATSLLLNKNPKAAAIASLISLLPSAKSMAIDWADINSEAVSAKAVTKSTLEKTTTPITIISPLPDLIATPGAQLSYLIDLKEHYEQSDPNSNLELSIQQKNGTAVPSWLSMNMGDFSTIRSVDLGGGGYSSINVVGNYAYAYGGQSVRILDVSNQNNPIIVGSLEGFSASDGCYTNGDYAYGLSYPTLTIIDIFDPYNPTIIKTITMAGAHKLNGLHDHLYIHFGGSNSSVKIFDISDPTNPIQVGEIVNSDLIYATFDDYIVTGGFKIFNVSVPSNPVLVSTTPSGSIYSAVGKGDYLYIADFSSGTYLKIYDITQITAPELVATSYLNSSPSNMVLEGDYLYLACRADGIKVFDVKDPSNPSWVSTFTSGNTAYNIFLSSNVGYVSHGSPLMTIFDASTRVLSGRPSASDRGLLELDVIVSNDVGNTVVDLMAIHVGDVNVLTIPNQQVYVGNSSIFTFSPDTFEFPGATFTYTANLVGGLPLPSFISFDPGTRTFIFAPTSGNQNTFRIEVSANDGYKTASATFDLSVPDRFPIVEQPLTDQIAYSGEAFEYAFSSNSFSDLDRDILNYSARLVGSNVLPGWLGFDSALRKFYGTPFGKNVYAIEVIANDGYGGVVSDTFTITVPNTAPIVLNPLGTQLASIGIPFSYTFNTNTFYDVDNDALTYSTGPLPDFLTFNPTTRTFSGTPQSTNVGSHSITLNAQDDSGGMTSTSFSLTVLSSSNNNPPVLIKEIPDLTETAGIPFSFSFDAGTFEDPEGSTLTYQAVLEGGSPLPDGLYFDSDTRTLSGMLQEPQFLRITIRAVDPYGAFAIDTFSLNVADDKNYPPVVLNSLPSVTATVHELFYFRIPEDTFADANNAKLTISVNQVGGKPLPKWLKWDPEKSSLSGKPGPWDTGTYQNNDISLEVWASDGLGSVKTTFTIIVQGESFWETFIKYGISFGSIAATGIGFLKSRALIWNFFATKKYRMGIERAYVGEEFSRDIRLDFKKVKEIKTYYNGKPLAQLPYGLSYEKNQLKGSPPSESKGRYTIRVYDQNNYINEEFELIIKNREENDPIQETSSFQSTFDALSRRTHTENAKGFEEGNSSSCFGFKKNNTSTMMTELLDDDHTNSQ